MKKFITFLIGVFLGVIIFIPKDNLYFTLQKYLSKKNIYINSKIDSSINLKLKKGTLYYKGINLITFKKIVISPFIVFNKVQANNVIIKFQNLKIQKIEAIYSIINPLKIYIDGDSNIGKIEGNINLLKGKIKVYILNLNNKFLKNMLQKDKKGYFYYASF